MHKFTGDLHVFTDDEEYIIAFNVCDAFDVHRKYTGVFVVSTWKQCDDSDLFTLHEDGHKYSATFGEWAIQRGRGYFASSM